MSLLFEKLNQDLQMALKEGGTRRVSVLRMAKAGIKNKQIEQRGQELSDEDILAVLAKEAKQRRESVAEYQKAGRQDLLAEEEAELKILEEYLPAQLSEEELQDLIATAIERSGAAGLGGVGKVMGILALQIKGRADGKVVSQMVRDRLSHDT